MFKNIKNVLNNENGGPNLEGLIGIALSLIMVCAARWFASGKHWTETTVVNDNTKIIGNSPNTGRSVYSWIRGIVKKESTMFRTKTS